MKVEFLKKFSKDLDKIKRPKDKESVLEIIKSAKQAENLNEIVGVKKLVGFKDAYRIRSGDMRIGIFFEGDRIQFARVAHRKEIYRIFP